MKALILDGYVVDVAETVFPAAPPMEWVDCQPDCQPGAWKYENGTCLQIPKYTSLSDAKLAKRKEINHARDAEENAGFTYLGKPFDSNAQAIKRLYGAAMAAQSAIAGGAVATDPFVDWTCADGTVLTMTYAQTAGVIAAMAVVGNALHIKARTLKAQIEAATTVEEVEAIAW